MPSDPIIAAFRKIERECKIIRERMDGRRAIGNWLKRRSLDPGEVKRRREEREAGKVIGKRVNATSARGHQSKGGTTSRKPRD